MLSVIIYQTNDKFAFKYQKPQIYFNHCWNSLHMLAYSSEVSVSLIFMGLNLLKARDNLLQEEST